jgi:hypothetical protein
LANLAAEMLGVPGLQQLAMQKIEHLGTKMYIFNIIDAIDHDFLENHQKGSRFHEYLKGKAKAAFGEDHTIFAKDAFLEMISHPVSKRW